MAQIWRPSGVYKNLAFFIYTDGAFFNFLAVYMKTVVFYIHRYPAFIFFLQRIPLSTRFRNPGLGPGSPGGASEGSRGSLGGFLGRPGACWGRPGGVLGRLGLCWGRLRLEGVFGAPWAVFGRLGDVLGSLGAVLGVLGPFWCLELQGHGTGGERVGVPGRSRGGVRPLPQGLGDKGR